MAPRRRQSAAGRAADQRAPPQDRFLYPTLTLTHVQAWAAPSSRSCCTPQPRGRWRPALARCAPTRRWTGAPASCWSARRRRRRRRRRPRPSPRRPARLTRGCLSEGLRAAACSWITSFIQCGAASYGVFTGFSCTGRGAASHGISTDTVSGGCGVGCRSRCQTRCGVGKVTAHPARLCANVAW